MRRLSAEATIVAGCTGANRPIVMPGSRRTQAARFIQKFNTAGAINSSSSQVHQRMQRSNDPMRRRRGSA
jgi:hypothetical protein